MADQGTLDFRLANITFQDLPRSRDYPDLYYHVSTPPAPAGSSGCDGVTFDPGTTRLLDFATYLNALSYEKWRRYTTVDNVWLHLRLCGACTVSLTRIDATAAAPTRTVVATREVTATQNGDGWTTLDLPYDDVDGATLLAFEVLTHGPVSFGEAYYYSKVDPVQVRHVELALATTTFRNERYVLPNIELVRREILGSDEPIARGFTMHVVDNGRTLTPEQVEGPRILLHPNPNAGGSGGFTRGMIEAMEQEPRATHVLLMDDDVQVSPEAIKRTYNILSLLRPEWDDAFVSGAYLSLERQDEFTENVGYVNARGAFGPLLHTSRIDTLEQIVGIETTEPRQHNRYAGWWYCAIPVASIERNGLPLPFFIRGDDAEYGARCATKFITMNGICIWHLKLAYKFRAALERYFVPRNSLTAQATTGVFQDVDFMAEFHYNMGLDLKSFNYDAAELSLLALEDFMKGPEYLAHADPNKLMMRRSKLNEQLKPIEELIEEDPRVAEVAFNPIALFRSTVDHSVERLEDSQRPLHQRAVDFLTYNGHRFTPAGSLHDDIGVIPYNCWHYSPNEMRGHNTILAVTPDGRQGVLRHRDQARFDDLYRRWEADQKLYNSRRDELRAQWAAARDELTSVAFWKGYLGIDG